ncbi:hypothetical protein Trydic_g19312, partial [Trypoxylus dichotomus]
RASRGLQKNVCPDSSVNATGCRSRSAEENRSGFCRRFKRTKEVVEAEEEATNSVSLYKASGSADDSTHRSLSPIQRSASD